MPDENKKSMNKPNEVTIVETNRANYLAAHPEAKQIHELKMAQFQKSYSKLKAGAEALVHEFVMKAENAREIGIILIEWCEESLPGGKLTRDLYEQHKHEFIDARGQHASFEFLFQAIKLAKENHEPIQNFDTAIKYRQTLMLGVADENERIEAPKSDRGTMIVPKDDLRSMREVADPANFHSKWEALKANKNYVVDGKFVEHQDEILAEEWKTFYADVEEMKSYHRSRE